jgi:hypothetical protein
MNLFGKKKEKESKPTSKANIQKETDKVKEAPVPEKAKVAVVAPKPDARLSYGAILKGINKSRDQRAQRIRDGQNKD